MTEGNAEPKKKIIRLSTIHDLTTSLGVVIGDTNNVKCQFRLVDDPCIPDNWIFEWDTDHGRWFVARLIETTTTKAQNRDPREATAKFQKVQRWFDNCRDVQCKLRRAEAANRAMRNWLYFFMIISTIAISVVAIWK